MGAFSLNHIQRVTEKNPKRQIVLQQQQYLSINDITLNQEYSLADLFHGFTAMRYGFGKSITMSESAVNRTVK